MQYVLLIYGDDADWDARTDDDVRALTRVRRLSSDLRARESCPRRRAAAGATATTVRVRNGDTLVTDGPFAETKECSAAST